MKLTFKEVKRQISDIGMTVRKTQDGEYRVNFPGGSEASAYYASDMQDAIDTAKEMKRNTIGYGQAHGVTYKGGYR